MNKRISRLINKIEVFAADQLTDVEAFDSLHLRAITLAATSESQPVFERV